MNRPIKFRGVSLDTGEFVYGDLRIIGIRPHIFKEAQCYYDEELIEVEPDSVAQLVGFDRDGNEVYEGDKILIDDAGEDEFFATCLPVGVNHWGGCFLHGGNFIFTKEFSLKEACQNPWNALQEIDDLIERHVEEAKQ